MRFILAAVFVSPAAVALLPVAIDSARAEQGHVDVGVRGAVIIGDGQPANDMIGYGVIGRWAFRDSWYLGVAFDSVTFDYETPYRILGIESVEEIDPSNEFSRISLMVERRYGRTGSPWSWYWTAGAGFASIDVGENAVGTTTDGGTFEIATTADDEAHLILGGGLRRALGEQWALEGVLTIQHHMTDYQLVDLVSGATGSIGSQTPYGLTLGVSFEFH